MSAIFTALGTMAVIALVGWVIARAKVLGPGAEVVLARLVFTVAAPALLFSTIATADLHLLLQRTALVTAVTTTGVALVAALVLGVALRRSVGETTIGTLSASYLNAGNLGLPLAVYLVGDPVIVVPTLMFQLLVLAPVSFVVLDSRGGESHGWRALLRGLGRSLRNPIIIAALAGVLVAALPLELPGGTLEPFRVVGAAAPPLGLLALGMSWAGPRTAGGRTDAVELTVVVVLRSVVHPLLAWLLATALGLTGVELLGVVIMAALPTAQNVLVYAMRYGEGQGISRSSQAVTTVLAVPVLVAIAALLG